MPDTSRFHNAAPFPCNPLQLSARARHPVQSGTGSDKTKPIAASVFGRDTRTTASLNRASSPVMDGIAPMLRAACDVVRPSATACDPLQPKSAPCKTKPILPGELSDPRRLAAARLLAVGRSVPDAARELRLSRSTIWRWQRDPAFRAELRRIHERMIAPVPRR